MIRFGHLDIDFDDRVLTPRTWTVRQSGWAAKLAAELPDGPMLELCSGAGQIGLLAAALTGRRRRTSGPGTPPCSRRSRWPRTRTPRGARPRPSGPAASSRSPRSRRVAEYLRNTPAIARSSYVDPRVLELHEQGRTIRVRDGVGKDPQARRAAAERAVLRLLTQDDG